MIERLILSLLITLLLEFTYALGWKIRSKDLLLVLAVNVLTNPLVVLFHNQTAHLGIAVSIAVPELAAVAVEAVLLKRFGKDITYPILFAICANFFSFFAGLVINYFVYGG